MKLTKLLDYKVEIESRNQAESTFLVKLCFKHVVAFLAEHETATIFSTHVGTGFSPIIIYTILQVFYEKGLVELHDNLYSVTSLFNNWYDDNRKAIFESSIDLMQNFAYISEMPQEPPNLSDDLVDIFRA